MRVADVVAQSLFNHHVRHAFGMPGGEVITLVDALVAAGIKFVLSRHETAGAIMAAGTHAVTGTAAVLVTTVGPGLANAINGIADAWQERVPLIVISGVVDHAIRGRYTHQVIDQAALVRPIVKASFEIELGSAGPIIARAIQLAMTPPFGPVHIDLAPGTADHEAPPNDRPSSPCPTYSPRLSSDDSSIVELAGDLRKATRPLMLCGYEAVQSQASKHVVELADRLNCPVFTTYKAKGLIPERHRLSLGAIGLSPLGDAIAMELVHRADLVLLVGFDPIELRDGWLDPFHDGANVIEITAHPHDHGMFVPSKRVLAMVPACLEAVLERLERGGPATWIEGDIPRTKAKQTELFSVPQSWGPHAVFDTLNQLLPEKSVVTVDSGAHRILLSQMLIVDEPRGVMQSAGFCTMGAAIPLAVGVKLARPEATVVAVLGDGGMDMCLGEVATLRDLGITVVVIVLQDESLALIELKQRKAGLASAGVRLGRTPYEDIARSFGGYAARASSADLMRAALADALVQQTFSLIVCDVEASDYADRI